MVRWETLMNEEIEVGRLLGHIEVPVAPSAEFTRSLRQQLLGELRGEHSPRGDDVGASPTPIPSRASSLAAGSPRTPIHQRRSALPALGAAACVLGIAVFYLLVVTRASPTTRLAGSNAGYEVYLAGGSLARVDPMTLADVDDASRPPTAFAATDGPVAVSADGSTIAAVKEAANEDRSGYRVSVIDTRTGAERVSIPWRYPIESVELSADGSRLVVGTMSGTMELGPGWHLYDSGTGRLLGQVESGGDSAVGWSQIERTLVAPDARRLYRLIVPRTSRSWNASIKEHLLVDDLVTGEVVGKIDLPGFLAGVVPSADPLHYGFTPAMTVSPDGNKLVLVNAVEEAVTIVDTRRLAVERTLDLERGNDDVSRALAWLGVVPREAAAKGVGGIVLEATFAPDGRHLYVWDRSPERISAEGDRLPTDRRGLQVIDLTTGTIIAEGFADSHILDVVPAPDGESLLVTVATGHDERGQPTAYSLWRLTSDLTRTAERTLGFEPHVAIVMRQSS